MKTPESIRSRRGTAFRPLVVAGLLYLAFLPAHAEDDVSLQGGVEMAPARIRTLEGAAALERQQEQDRVDATINSPVFPGDRLQTDAGRAEVEFPDGSTLWMDSETRVEFLGIRDPAAESSDNTVLRLHRGTLELDYRDMFSGDGEETRIDTPESSIYFLGPGRFRVESYQGFTTLVSLRGVAELAGDAGSMLVRSGQKSQVSLGAAPDNPVAINTLRLDDFDQWCEERLAGYLSDEDAEDRQYAQAVPVPVRQYVTELDSYGDWQWMGEFGWVWRPTIYQVGWRPYVHGHWIWSPYGWTWVADEPWGWVPYHYGRWSFVTSAGWVWIPGGVYSSAWVSWAVTPTYVGWCPLDFYNRPAYVSISYVNVTARQYGGGWNFLPLNRFSDRGASRLIVRADRVPNLSGGITTRALPRFSPDQVRTRPEISRQILRESARNEYRLEDPGRRSSLGLVSFRQADRRETKSQADFDKRHRAPAARPVPPARDAPAPGRTPKPLPRAPATGRSPLEIQNPHATTGAYREQGRGTSGKDWSRPSRADSRQTPATVNEKGASPRKGSQNRREAAGTARPRRESLPPGRQQESPDASRRVLERILGTGAAKSPAQGAGPRGEKPGSSNGRPSQVEGKSKAHPTQTKVEAPKARPSPPRQPPERSKEKGKKDKP